MLGAAGLMMVCAVTTGPRQRGGLHAARTSPSAVRSAPIRCRKSLVSGANMPVSELGDALASDDFDQIWAVLSRSLPMKWRFRPCPSRRISATWSRAGAMTRCGLSMSIMGRIGEFSAAGGAFVALDDREGVSGTFGLMTAQAMDLPWVIRFYPETAGDGDNPYRPAYEALLRRRHDLDRWRVRRDRYRDDRGRKLRHAPA